MSQRVLVGSFVAQTRAMGPGPRACLWVAGCSIKCRGCATPEFIGTERGTWHEVGSVCGWLDDARHKHGIEGVSFSGGEPFEQAGALAAIARHARSLGLSVQSWSGYVRAHLEGADAPPDAAALLAELDVLIDGPFMRRKLAGDPYRGSSNQVIHYLTDRYGPTDFARAGIDIRLPQKPGDQLVINGVADTRAMRVALKLLGVG